MIKVYESKTQIVIRGVDTEIIENHISSEVQKVMCVYGTTQEFLEKLRGKDFNSDKIAFYLVPKQVKDAWIAERHRKLDEDTEISWSPIKGVKG